MQAVFLFFSLEELIEKYEKMLGYKQFPANFSTITMVSIISLVMEKNQVSDSMASDIAICYLRSLTSGLIKKYGESRTVCLDILKEFDQLWPESLLNKHQPIDYQLSFASGKQTSFRNFVSMLCWTASNPEHVCHQLYFC